MKYPSYRPRRVLRMAATEEKVGLRQSQIREKVAAGEFPKPIKLSASGRAVGFLEHEVEEYLDARIAERDQGYAPSAAEQARIEAAREGRRKKRAAEQSAIAHEPRSRKRPSQSGRGAPDPELPPAPGRADHQGKPRWPVP